MEEEPTEEGEALTGGAQEVVALSRRVEDAPVEEVSAEAICAKRWTVSMKSGHSFSSSATEATRAQLMSGQLWSYTSSRCRKWRHGEAARANHSALGQAEIRRHEEAVSVELPRPVDRQTAASPIRSA